MEYQSEAGQLLAPCIKDVVTATGSRLFLVKREDADALGNAIDELLEKRLIHEVPRTDLPSGIRDSHHAYLADYGLWLDWQHALGGRDDEYDERDVVLDPNQVADLVVDPSEIEMTDMLRCPHCASVFSKRSRAFQVRQLCPECLLDATEV
jgi:hypothetical protein